jgi:phosphate transport system permease protein
MRPLSANIAVEIPEAPVAGTLYRVLFLSAVILFLMTFVLNTVAEIVRQRLRRKYGQF